MIIPHFNGRMSNNLFQLAACIGRGGEYGILPNTGHWQHQAIYKYFPNISVYKGSYSDFPIYQESSFNYTPIPTEGNLQLTGFFQSEKYFAHKRKEILQLFDLNYTPNNCVSLHWRLTDYLNPLNGMCLTPMEYYEEALSYFPNHQVLVFSDDIEFCKRHLVGDRFHFMAGNEFEDLSYMASCQHNIIGNSSFSWWGAWLNQNPDKIVISPSYKQWFSETNLVKDPIDLIPETWKQLEI